MRCENCLRIIEDGLIISIQEDPQGSLIIKCPHCKSFESYLISNIPKQKTPDEYQRRKFAYFKNPRWKEYGAYNFATFVNNINACIPVQQRRQITSDKPIPIQCSTPGCGFIHMSNKLCPKCNPESNEPVDHNKVRFDIQGLISSMSARNK